MSAIMTLEPPYAQAPAQIHDVMHRALKPRKVRTVSQWADAERRLSSKGSAEPGPWRTRRNPILREPMDALSTRSRVSEVVLKFPIQIGKTEVAVNLLGYTMVDDPCPIMVALPGEVSFSKWISQKLSPMLEETPTVRATLTTESSRDGANRRDFKDFLGGQLFIEHAGSPQRLKSTTVKILLVDEVDEFANNYKGGSDPIEELDGRTSSYPGQSKSLYISTPTIEGVSRIQGKWEASDQRYYHVPCPHCGHRQPMQWDGLVWNRTVTRCWYVCRECASAIEERDKTEMILNGEWVPSNPESRIRGYTVNGLYYPLGLGPRWLTLANKWKDAQGDNAKLQAFINNRLAETFEDPAMRKVKDNVIADRAEPYRLRTAPVGVLVITAGVDTQDDRLAVHITGWGRRLASWTLDYIELPGDPADDAVWAALTDLLNRPVEHASGVLVRIEATCIDAGGHRTEDVYNYVRARRIRRPVAIFGAKANTAPVLSKGTLVDVTYRGKTDKRGLRIHHVGTVGIKHRLYGRLSKDADLEPDQRLVRFSDELPTEYFTGLVSETYNPLRNRFDHKSGVRNEPLDTYTYSYAATHHPALHLHRYTRADWDEREKRLAPPVSRQPEKAQQVAQSSQATKRRRRGRAGLGSDDWNL